MEYLCLFSSSKSGTLEPSQRAAALDGLGLNSKASPGTSCGDFMPDEATDVADVSTLCAINAPESYARFFD